MPTITNILFTQVKTARDATIARRLITIAVTDFLCWFPVGLLGVLAFSGISLPDEYNVAVAILVLPLNSAFNPLIYTLNMLLERRAKAKEAALFAKLQAEHLKESLKLENAQNHDASDRNKTSANV